MDEMASTSRAPGGSPAAALPDTTDTMGQAEPPSTSGPQILHATYSNTPLYEMICKETAVMKRRSDSWMNATQILKVAGVEKGLRLRVLDQEKSKGRQEKVVGGNTKYQGTWIPLDRAIALCREYNCEDELRPLIDYVDDGREAAGPAIQEKKSTKNTSKIRAKATKSSLIQPSPEQPKPEDLLLSFAASSAAAAEQPPSVPPEEHFSQAARRLIMPPRRPASQRAQPMLLLDEDEGESSKMGASSSAPKKVARPKPTSTGAPKIFPTTYSGTLVWEMMCNGTAVMKRRSDSWLNATQILKVAGLEDKAKRAAAIDKDVRNGEHQKVPGFYTYQGTWIPLERGIALCRKYKCEELMRPIIDFGEGEGGGEDEQALGLGGRMIAKKEPTADTSKKMVKRPKPRFSPEPQDFLGEDEEDYAPVVPIKRKRERERELELEEQVVAETDDDEQASMPRKRQRPSSSTTKTVRKPVVRARPRSPVDERDADGSEGEPIGLDDGGLMAALNNAWTQNADALDDANEEKRIARAKAKAKSKKRERERDGERAAAAVDGSGSDGDQRAGKRRHLSAEMDTGAGAGFDGGSSRELVEEAGADDLTDHVVPNGHGSMPLPLPKHPQSRAPLPRPKPLPSPGPTPAHQPVVEAHAHLHAITF
ncbi:4-oxalocrotonate tautomerase [Mycena chlorophos]|uniref:4-oxalocrotonate tautomerase n=1 Tax=Mycena chlorophos TaxID=658473 RepID=A0A8H6SU52_MYCCL|nr:4-oxalocrotonate tautomerase [Mycena chlorophos]